MTSWTPAASAALPTAVATRPISVSGVPSSRMNAVDRYSGVAPDMARSLTVPLTARSPIDPPGKNIGLTTNESVENASRAPPVSPAPTHRRVAQLGVGGAAERRQEQVLDELAGHRPAASVPHHDGRGVPQRQRADPALEVQVAHRAASGVVLTSSSRR